MKKEKFILAAILFPISLVVSFFISGSITLFLAKEWEGVHQLGNIRNLIARLASDKQTGMLFLCVEGFLCALILMMVVMGKSHEIYESAMHNITDKIKTPVHAGQNQHGSSKWLDRKAYRNVFGAYTLDPRNPMVAELIRLGRDDLRFTRREICDENVKSHTSAG